MFGRRSAFAVRSVLHLSRHMVLSQGDSPPSQDITGLSVPYQVRSTTMLPLPSPHKLHPTNSVPPPAQPPGLADSLTSLSTPWVGRTAF